VLVAAGETVVETAGGSVEVTAGAAVVVVAEGNVVEVAAWEADDPSPACAATGTLQPGGSLVAQDIGPPTLTSVMATWSGK
jgi:hypothetical protein